MTYEPLEYRPVDEKEIPSQQDEDTFPIVGLSILSVNAPGLTEEQRLEIESLGYDPTTLIPIVNWVQSKGIAGERAAATIRGAVNDLVGKLNELESKG